MKKSLFLLLFYLFYFNSYSQIYSVPFSGSKTITACSGKVTDGVGYYVPNNNGVLTINPDKAGNYAKLTFTSWSVDSWSSDYLYIYDGASTSASLIGTYSYNSPGSVTATNTSGALTLKFVTDSYYNYDGFEANLQCVTVTNQPDLTVSYNSIPTTFFSGTTVNTTVRVNNEGNAYLNYSSMGIYLSADQYLDAADSLLSTIAVNFISASSYSYVYPDVTIPAKTTAGSYYLIYAADDNKLVTELSDDNNFLAQLITVQKPTFDLQPKSLTINPSNVPLGGSAYLGATLNNKSSVTVSNVKSSVFISADNKVDDKDIKIGTFQTGPISAGSSANIYETVHIPADASTGLFYLILQSDSDNQFEETLENNNITTTAISIVEPEVDLIPVLSSFAPSKLVKEIASAFTYTIYNEGNISSTSSHLALYLSKDTIYNAGDQYLALNNISAISAGNYENNYASVTIPKAVMPGKYYVIAITDFLNLVSETNELNNQVVKEVLVEEQSIDISAISFSVYTSEPVSGGSLSYNSQIRNEGNVSFGYFNNGLYISKDSVFNSNATLIGTTNHYGIDPGLTQSYSENVTIPSSYVAGVYYIFLVADYNSLLKEKDESNNILKQKITIKAPFVDLQVYSYSNTQTVDVGNSVYASGYVFNNGNTYSDYSYLGYYLSKDQILDDNDTYLSETYIYSVSGQSTSSYSSYVTIPSGTAKGEYYLLLAGDHTQRIDESDETNNLSYIQVTVTEPNIDLSVHTYSTSQSVTAGNSVYLSGYVNNSGSTYAEYNYLGYYLSKDQILDGNDTHLSESYISSVSGSSTTSFSSYVTIPQNTLKGVYYILLVGDYTKRISESDETNNITSIGLTVTEPYIDLIPYNYSGSQNVFAGSSTYISGYVYNGGTSYSPSTYLGYYLSNDNKLDASDTYLSESYIYSISGQYSSSFSQYVTIPSGTTKGNYYLLLVADYYNSIKESDETNNVTAINVNVTEPSIDLTVFTYTGPQTTIAGNSVYLSGYVYNQGNSYANNSNLGYYLSKDSLLDTNDNYLISSNISAMYGQSSSSFSGSITISGNTSTGKYYILMVADDSQIIDETNEMNNVASVSVTVAEPFIDLFVSNIYAEGIYPSGSEITVTAKIQNTGTQVSGEFTGQLFLSKNQVIDSDDILLDTTYSYSVYPGSYGYMNFTTSLPSNLDANEYYLIVRADNSGIISETDETNNTGFSKIIISGEEANISFFHYPSNDWTLVKGIDYITKYTIKISGAISAKSYTVSYFLSKDSTNENSKIYLGEYNGIVSEGLDYIADTISVPYHVPVGSYQLMYIIDYKNSIAETFESDNFYYNFVVVDVLTGVEDAQAKAGLKVSPNPASSYLTISNLKNSEEAEISIINEIGEILLNQKISQNQQVDVSELNAGFYTVKIEHSNRVDTEKLIIVH